MTTGNKNSKAATKEPANTFDDNTATGGALAAADSGVPDLAGMGFKVTRKITLPLLSTKDGGQYAVQLQGKFYVGKEITQKGEVAKKPAIMVDVIDLLTGQLMQMICPTVLKANIEEAFPDDSYVGKCIAFERFAKKEGKNYNTFSLAEIEKA